MILGILSDSHDDHKRTAQAIRVVQNAGAEAFVHCGDIGGKRVLEALAGLEVWFVWGNTDIAGPALRAYAGVLGLPLPNEIPLRLELADRKIAVFHGHEPLFTRVARLAQHEQTAAFEEALGECDYLLFGHTHKPTDLHVGRVRLINPGALRRARPPTVATLDLEHDAVRFWEVE